MRPTRALYTPGHSNTASSPCDQPEHFTHLVIPTQHPVLATNQSALHTWSFQYSIQSLRPTRALYTPGHSNTASSPCDQPERFTHLVIPIQHPVLATTQSALHTWSFQYSIQSLRPTRALYTPGHSNTASSPCDQPERFTHLVIPAQHPVLATTQSALHTWSFQYSIQSLRPTRALYTPGHSSTASSPCNQPEHFTHLVFPAQHPVLATTQSTLHTWSFQYSIQSLRPTRALYTPGHSSTASSPCDQPERFTHLVIPIQHPVLATNQSTLHTWSFQHSIQSLQPPRALYTPGHSSPCDQPEHFTHLVIPAQHPVLATNQSALHTWSFQHSIQSLQPPRALYTPGHSNTASSPCDQPEHFTHLVIPAQHPVLATNQSTLHTWSFQHSIQSLQPTRALYTPGHSSTASSPCNHPERFTHLVIPAQHPVLATNQSTLHTWSFQHSIQSLQPPRALYTPGHSSTASSPCNHPEHFTHLVIPTEHPVLATTQSALHTWSFQH